MPFPDPSAPRNLNGWHKARGPGASRNLDGQRIVIESNQLVAHDWAYDDARGRARRAGIARPFSSSFQKLLNPLLCGYDSSVLAHLRSRISISLGSRTRTRTFLSGAAGWCHWSRWCRRFTPIIDTGAAYSLLNGTRAPSIGLELMAGKQVMPGGLSGFLAARLQRVTLEILGSPIDCEVAFSESEIRRELLDGLPILPTCSQSVATGPANRHYSP